MHRCTPTPRSTRTDSEGGRRGRGVRVTLAARRTPARGPTRGAGSVARPPAPRATHPPRRRPGPGAHRARTSSTAARAPRRARATRPARAPQARSRTPPLPPTGVRAPRGGARHRGAGAALHPRRHPCECTCRPRALSSALSSASGCGCGKGPLLRPSKTSGEKPSNHTRNQGEGARPAPLLVTEVRVRSVGRTAGARRAPRAGRWCDASAITFLRAPSSRRACAVARARSPPWRRRRAA